MKVLTGKVISNKLNKTVKVAVERTVVHPIYKKRSRVSKNYLVHDENGVQVGDTVKFAASKPYSKMVKWNIIKAGKETK